MSRIVTIELEDDEYQVLERFAETYGLSTEGMAALAIVAANHCFIRSVGGPPVLEGLNATELEKVKEGSIYKAIERAKKKEAG